jgi:hypothetical protein
MGHDKPGKIFMFDTLKRFRSHFPLDLSSSEN